MHAFRSYFNSVVQIQQAGGDTWRLISPFLVQIRLGASEFLREVSGTVGPFFSIPSTVTSLRLVSNLRRYGPFGVPLGTPFCSKVKENNSIVGFFGRSGAYLHAVDVYVRPI